MAHAPSSIAGRRRRRPAELSRACGGLPSILGGTAQSAPDLRGSHRGIHAGSLEVFLRVHFQSVLSHSTTLHEPVLRLTARGFTIPEGNTKAYTARPSQSARSTDRQYAAQCDPRRMAGSSHEPCACFVWTAETPPKRRHDRGRDHFSHSERRCTERSLTGYS